MNFDSIYIDKLIAMREDARQMKNYALSDNIRNYLDSKHIFIFDSKQGQIVYHRKTGTRSDLIKEIKEDLQAQKLFDSWLFSMQQTKQIHYEPAQS
ncbi:hypothetical protein [Aestuariivivens sediminicola]|uniref:hypothetical protein n=1 Tax=Aestuariivivens sediminicola TaxID=2913560 RepID=UPI001F59FA66|nr:hypothetical protein [Aestuariivivens sediminicola]